VREFLDDRTPYVILDDMGGCERVYRNPVAAIRADSTAEVSSALAAVDETVARGRHVAGYLSYELGYVLEPRLAALMPRKRLLPLLWFGVFDSCEFMNAEPGAKGPRTHAGPPAYEWGRDAHRAAFDRVRALISAGDLYQANVSFRGRFAFAGDPYAFYRELKRQSGASNCAFVFDGERQILSLSPELFFSIDAKGCAVVKPMKGTAPRGPTIQADLCAIAGLRASEKERAENLMIVDLLRNDLAKISVPGSVRVDSLFDVETYATLHQMVSTVSARIAPPQSLSRIIRALFPCGSITGAPKLRAMEVIREIESSARGAYCGAIGHCAPDGSARFNVAIRTLTIADGRGELGVGSAVVHDSRAAAEYDECRLKARFFECARKPLQLIETLHFASGKGYVRKELHLKRMEHSAVVLGLGFDHAAVQVVLDHAVRETEASARVRLLLDENGEFRAEATMFSDTPSLWRYAISPCRVDSRDPLIRHKTSRRRLYDRERDRMSAQTGCDEILFLNEKDELSEGSRSNIFLARAGQLFTPHIDSGLLDGRLRRELLDRGDCTEARLTCEDLKAADGVFLGNSLRGLVPAAPV